MKRWLIILVLLVASPALVYAQQGGAPEEDRARQVTKPPELLRHVEAEYTDEAVENRVEGSVELRLTIAESGEVARVEVVEGLGHGLDEAAREAARQFEFSPAEVDGEPAAVTLDFKVSFSLPLMPAELRGRVVDADSGELLEGVRVAIEYVGQDYDEAPKAAMTTEDDGEFSFSQVPPGPYRLQVQSTGYPDRTESIELGSGETVEATYRLSKSAINLRGEVREAGTRKPLPGVRVRVTSLSGEVEASGEGEASGEEASSEDVRTTYTDADASFSFHGLDAGPCRIVIDADGYETIEVEWEIVDGELTQGTFYLEAEYYDEFTVKTTVKREQTEISRERIGLDELRRIPGTGGDVVRVVQNMPGVARPSYTAGSIVVRGAAPQDTQVFLQGDSIPLVYHFLGGPAVLNSEMIEAVDFYPGNFSAYYGRATGGIVELRTRSPRQEGFHGFTEIDILDTTVQVEGPIGENFSFALSGRRSYLDTILPHFLPEDVNEHMYVAPRYYDYQSWLTWRGVDGHTLELFIYGSDDEIASTFDNDEQPIGTAEVQFTGVRFENSFHRAQLRWKWRPRSEPVENDLMVSFGRNRTGFEVAENLHYIGDYYQTQIRQDFKVHASETFGLRFGADMQLGVVDYRMELPRIARDRDFDIDGTGVSKLNFSHDGLIGEDSLTLMRPAFYVEGTWNPLEALELVPGLRLDYFGDTKDMSVSPRFTARFKALEDVTLKGGVGLFTQPPLPGEADEHLGNPDLTYEEAIHYAVGGEWQILEHLKLDTTFFYRDLSSLTNATADVELEPNGESVENLVYDNEGEGRAFGVELLLRHYPKNKFFGWIAYTLSRAERLDPVAGAYHPFEYDQTHILTTVAGYNLPWGFDASARFRLVTGTPHTPVVGSVFDADLDKYTKVYGPRLSARNDTFHQLDVRLDKRFVFDTFMLGIYAEVLNAYNAVNEEARHYSYDASESTSVPGLPLIPTLGVNGRF